MFIKHNLMAFLAYFLTTVTVFLLMGQPVQDISVWPAVGVGIAVASVWGYKAIVGLYIAEYCLILVTQQHNPLLNYSLNDFFMAQVCIGAALFRSYFGAFLIKYLIGYPNSLVTHQSILKFTFTVGLISTLISSVLCNLIELPSDVQNDTNVMLVFFNSWSRDFLGFIIFAPLTMIFISEAKSIWRPRYMTVGLPVIVTFAFILLIFNKTQQHNMDHAKDNLEIKNELLIAKMEDHIEDIDDLMHNILVHAETMNETNRKLANLINNQTLKATIYIENNAITSKQFSMNTAKQWQEKLNELDFMEYIEEHQENAIFYDQELNAFINLYNINDQHLMVIHNLAEQTKNWLKQFQLNFTTITLHLNDNNSVVLNESNSLLSHEVVLRNAPLNVNTKGWYISSRPSNQYFTAHQPELTYYITKLGFLFVGFINVMLLILSGKNILTKIQINERTLDLDTQTTQLRYQKKQYQALIEQHPVILWRQNIEENTIDYISNKVENAFQYPLENWLNTELFWINNIHQDDRKHVQQTIDDSIDSNQHFELEYRFIKADGSIAWVRDVINVSHEPDGKTELVGLMIDVTETQEAKLKQSISEKKYRTLFKHAVDTLIIINLDDGKIKDFNEKAIDLFSIDINNPDTSLNDYSLTNQPDGSFSKKKLQKIFRKLNDNKNHNFEWHMIDGKEQEIICDITLVKLPEQNSNIALANITDITEKKQHDKKINQLAYYDNLTKLPNREYFYSKFEYFHQLAIEKQMYGSIIYLDLDRFKLLNDSLGHQAGDELLKIVAQRIRKVSRKNDFCARLAGDEFIILTKKFDSSIESTLETSLVKSELILEALNEPYFLGDYEHFITPSIGISVFPFDDAGIDQIIHQADIAMYASKEKGKNTITIYRPEMIQLVSKRLEVEKAIREAFENNEFELHYQTQINHNREVLAVEALLRWRRLKSLNINTEKLINTIEQIGLAHELGYWVFDQACSQLEKWQSSFFPIKSMAINVSAKQFHQKIFIDQIKDIIESYNIKPSQIIIELTEAAIFEDMETLTKKLNELKKYGIRISLDDFGTGYSSLAYLKYLPIDQLKIDKMFIKELTSDEASKHIVSTIVNLANAMDIELIAEGIETEAQYRTLKELGCKNFQGYYFAKPTISDKVFKPI